MHASTAAITHVHEEPSKPSLRTRVASVDFVRGVAMVLMAIDHVRVYSGIPAGGPTFGVFFTRWITHFVAPTFVFLAGTAAYLHGRKLGDRGALSKFLVTRGLWLVFLEMTFLRIAWTFNFDFAHYLLAGVIWMLGWCMVLMAGLIWLPLKFNAIAGVAIIALHNLTSVFQSQLANYFGKEGPDSFLSLLYFGSGGPLGKTPLVILYVIVPWIGLMMAGYAFGVVVELPQERRRRICLMLGVALTLSFILLRALDGYGDPRPWRIKPAPPQATQASAQKAPARPPRPVAPALIRFLNTNKYPASLDFVLMTIGPMFLLLGLAEHFSGRIAGIITTFGRVPMFYYLLHIPLIHFAAVVVSLIRDGHVDHWLFENHPMGQSWPPPHIWSLWLLYLVYFLCLIALYFPCRWYAEFRARKKSAWLSYV